MNGILKNDKNVYKFYADGYCIFYLGFELVKIN